MAIAVSNVLDPLHAKVFSTQCLIVQIPPGDACAMVKDHSTLAERKKEAKTKERAEKVERNGETKEEHGKEGGDRDN